LGGRFAGGARFGRFAADDGGEAREEIVRHLARGAVDEAGADLRQLAADLRLDGIGEQGSAGRLVAELDLGPALGEAGRAARALAGDGVAIGRVEVGQGHLAAELRLDRTHLGGDLGRPFDRRQLLDLLAARNALFQDLGIVERLPNALARGRDAVFARHVHYEAPPTSAGS